MRCETCNGVVRFVDGEWRHAADMKCAAVVVAWPTTPLANDDAA